MLSATLLLPPPFSLYLSPHSPCTVMLAIVADLLSPTVVHCPSVVPSLNYRPPSCCCPHHPAVVQHSSWWIASYWWIAVLGLLPSIDPLSTIHYPLSTILLLLPTYTPSTSLLPPIDNPSFIIASVLVPGRFALIFWMSWIIWRNKVSLPSTFYELPV